MNISKELAALIRERNWINQGSFSLLPDISVAHTWRFRRIVAF